MNSKEMIEAHIASQILEANQVSQNLSGFRKRTVEIVNSEMKKTKTLQQRVKSLEASSAALEAKNAEIIQQMNSITKTINEMKKSGFLSKLMN